MKRVNKGEIWLMYVLHMYKCGTLTPEVISRKGVGERRRLMEGMT
jgi:hypothetical protein